MTLCPKCHYQRQATDGHTHSGICPRCGIAYSKYRPPDQRRDRDAPAAEPLEDEKLSLARLALNALTYVPENTDATALWGRVALYLVLVLWGFSFILAGVDWEKIGGSFLHSVNLPFHEFGHVLFGFFGRFMGILGGSLFQVLFPLVFVAAFSLQMRDNFAASVCLWWCGQNFIDVSPYIADAPYRALPLVGGMGEEAHDWGNLLTMTDSIDAAPALANTSFALGTLIMLISLAWAGWILRRQYAMSKPA